MTYLWCRVCFLCLLCPFVLPSLQQVGFLTLKDPSQDIFAQLPPEELQKWSAAEHPLDLKALRKELDEIEEAVYVNIRLVGFEGEGNQGIIIQEAEFSKYLNLFLRKRSDPLTIINTEGDGPHRLVTKRKFFFDVTRAPPRVTHDINDALKQYLVLDTDIRTVPYHIVDDIVKKDYNASGLGTQYTFYILNPKRVRDHYAYSQTTQPSGSVCETTIWAGQERYMWVDISAGPLSYGPHTSGDGGVAVTDLPSFSNHPFVRSHPEGFILDVVSFVWETCNSLVSPSMWHVPLGSWSELTLHLIVIHDHLVGDEEKSDLFDLDSIKAQIFSMPLYRGQSIKFKRSELSIIDNNICASLYKHSIKTHTSTVAKNTVRAHVHQYLDSMELHYWLQKYQANLFNMVGEQGNAVVPIYLFDVSFSDILLLDRFHQAVAFPDMIVGIQTPLPRVTYDLSCQGKWVSLDPRDATRPVLASLLQSIWGIAPTHEMWDVAHSRPRTSYLWTLGHTPFLGFSPSKRLSFSQLDSGPLHTLYVAINSTLATVSYLFLKFEEYQVPLHEALPSQDYQQLLWRWTLFKFKLREIQRHLALRNFESSHSFVTSLSHEIRAFRRILSDAAKGMDTAISCVARDSTMFRSVVAAPCLFTALAICSLFLWRCTRDRNR